MNSILIDSREPWPHPWAVHFSDAVKLERGTLETGDLALSDLPDGAVVERKTVGDLLACIGRERERFERELKRSRYAGRFMVIVEGTLADVLEQARGIHASAIIGTLAAWQRRYAPFCFAGNVETAARMTEAFLRGEAREIARATSEKDTARYELGKKGDMTPKTQKQRNRAPVHIEQYILNRVNRNNHRGSQRRH